MKCFFHKVKKLGYFYFVKKYGDPYGIRTRVTAVKGRCLNRLTKGPFLNLATSYSHRGKPSTTIGAEKLNFRVRYGNGCDLFAIATRLLILKVVPSKLDKESKSKE